MRFLNRFKMSMRFSGRPWNFLETFCGHLVLNGGFQTLENVKLYVHDAFICLYIIKVNLTGFNIAISVLACFQYCSLDWFNMLEPVNDPPVKDSMHGAWTGPPSNLGLPVSEQHGSAC